MGSFITAGLQIAKGGEELKISKREGKDIRKQGAIALAESEREADRLEESSEKFLQRQKLSFLKSGVRLEGTPLDVLARTERRGEEEVSAVRGAGVARAGLLRSKAKITERAGRAAFLGSLAGAGTSLAGAPT